MLTQYEVRVIRPWPGGPPAGSVIKPPASRREELLRLKCVERVEAAKPKKKRRHAAANG